MREWFESETEALVQRLPPHIQEPLRRHEVLGELLEVVMDLGREPEARFLNDSILLGSQEVDEEDIQFVIRGIGSFGDDNRAGIERTLHRVSAMRNRSGNVVGLTLRFGRAVYGTIRIIEDLIFTEKSVLLLGKPGVGKTTMLREIARVLADDAHRRVIVVDTSNEIAGDGDIPHPGIGRARRMQVPTPALQHAVMIEAVENHMPEVIVIDEIGTELDATAARTIAERGVQLVATAHGNTLENLIQNPTLSDLVGGVHTVTLGDDEARRRRTQKTILERRSAPTFDILVEIQGWNRSAVHPNVADVVDRILRGYPVLPETRTVDKDGEVRRTHQQREVHRSPYAESRPDGAMPPSGLAEQHADVEQEATRIMPYGVNKGKLQQAVKGTRARVELVSEIGHADLLLTTKNYYRRRTQVLRTAEQSGKPVYVLRRNTLVQIEHFIKGVSRRSGSPEHHGNYAKALREAEEAVTRVGRGNPPIELSPQGSYIRHLQHQIADRYGLSSTSEGHEPGRRVVVYRT